jgi:hypothetical protein
VGAAPEVIATNLSLESCREFRSYSPKLPKLLNKPTIAHYSEQP